MSTTLAAPARSHARWWTSALLLASIPFLWVLGVALWRTPYPISEAIALFEDISQFDPERLAVPQTSYWRPLFHLTLSGIWLNAATLGAKLAWVKALHIAPMLLLVVLFAWHVRPARLRDAAAALVATAVLVGSPGFRDNLEIPLSYTAVGMPLLLGVWMLLHRAPRWWTAPVVVMLTLVAIGFKEQGLAIIPMVVVAWWTRAPGARRGLAISVVVLACAYVAFRLNWREGWPIFEQSMGLGFDVVEASDAIARFGEFPYWMYAYNSASTVANVLFAEPIRGRFVLTRSIVYWQTEPWAFIHLISSIGTTAVIAWWGVRKLKETARDGWSEESRTFVAMIVVLLACGALSFNYSRDRLGGMALVLYAASGYFACRAAVVSAANASRPRRLAVAAALVMLALGWHVRALGTIEVTRMVSWRNHNAWLTDLVQRRREFAERQVYLGIMESMVAQGAAPGAPRPTPYPGWFKGALLPASQQVRYPFAYSLAEAIANDDTPQAYDFIRDGQDPNGFIAARDPVLTGGRDLLISPLVWAVATQREQSVLMLLGFGARAERPMDRKAACLAERLGNARLASVLRTYSDQESMAACPDVPPGTAPLVAITQS